VALLCKVSVPGHFRFSYQYEGVTGQSCIMHGDGGFESEPFAAGGIAWNATHLVSRGAAAIAVLWRIDYPPTPSRTAAAAVWLQDLESNILPALAVAPSLQLHMQQDLAKRYRRAAATAPTRPHGWFLGAPGTTSAAAAKGEGAHGVMGAASAAVAATKEALKRMVAAPVRAGVAAVDAAADVARFGPGKVPQKL
jgi:hypothetical protein